MAPRANTDSLLTSSSLSSTNVKHPTTMKHKKLSRKENKMMEAETAIKKMVSSLSQHDKETAARSSYQYLVASQQGTASKQKRDELALAMAKRYLIGEKGNVSKATKQFKATLEYRSKNNVDEIRTCLGSDQQTSKNNPKLSAGIAKELEDGIMSIRGYDKQNRALLHYVPKNTPREPNEQYFCHAHVHIMERALACSERASNGTQTMMNVLVDFKDFTNDDAPSLALAKELLTTMKDHYPERLFRVYLVDAPGMFRAFWTVMKPFLDSCTRQKFQFITGDPQKMAAFENTIGLDHAMPYMLPDGKLVDPVDMETFLYKTPLDYAYHEE